MYNNDRTLYYRNAAMNDFVYSVMCQIEHTISFVHYDLCEIHFTYMGHKYLLCCTFEEYVRMVRFANSNRYED